MNLTPEQEGWLNNWLNGLRNGTLTTAAGFVAKMGYLGVSPEDRGLLNDFLAFNGIPALCDVVEAYFTPGNALTIQQLIDNHSEV